MSSDIAIRVQNISKAYQIYDKPQDRLKQSLWRGRKSFYREFKALDDVSFEVKKGETIGIIGRNGAGKSTLLQIICGTLSPTSGTIFVYGRVAALLELGAGFNPEFTGKENVYMNASILGLSRKETDLKYESIVDFADIGDFINQPVKVYSSGMYVRLAFAVATSVSPDILVVDEALAVGDVAFQYKCLRRIEKMRDSGCAVLYVSHGIGSVRNFCEYGLWLDAGKKILFGNSNDVADLYEDFVRKEENIFDSSEKTVSSDNFFIGEESVSGGFTSIEMFGSQMKKSNNFIYGENVYVGIKYKLASDVCDGVVIGCAIYREDGLYVCGLNTKLDEYKVPSSKGCHAVKLCFTSLPLLSGSYYLKLGLFDSKAIVELDFIHYSNNFWVTSPYVAEGVLALNHDWSIGD